MHASPNSKAGNFIMTALSELHEIKAEVKLAPLGIKGLHNNRAKFIAIRINSLVHVFDAWWKFTGIELQSSRCTSSTGNRRLACQRGLEFFCRWRFHIEIEN